MPSVPERLFTALLRVFAVVVALVPLAAAAVLLAAGVSAALSSRALPGANGLAATALFTIGVAAAAALLGGSLGIGCAFAAQELAPGAVRRSIEAAVAFLGAMPAVAFGWFAAVTVAPFVTGRAFGVATQFAAATAVLTVMVMPTTCSLVTRALRRVPASTRHASAAAGASRLQTTALVIVPALRRRIGAAVLAAFARAVGEATALQMLFASLAAYGIAPAATTASWIFATATAAPSAAAAAELSTGALALLALAAACGFIVAREYRGAQWA